MKFSLKQLAQRTSSKGLWVVSGGGHFYEKFSMPGSGCTFQSQYNPSTP